MITRILLLALDALRPMSVDLDPLFEHRSFLAALISNIGKFRIPLRYGGPCLSFEGFKRSLLLLVSHTCFVMFLPMRGFHSQDSVLVLVLDLASLGVYDGGSSGAQDLDVAFSLPSLIASALNSSCGISTG